MTALTDHVVVDVEIAHTIEEVGGWDATDKMGVAVACVWEYVSQRMRVYGPEDIEALRSRLLRADRISGYNIWRFDYPVIWGRSKEQWEKDRWSGSGWNHFLSKTNDLLRRIWQAMGLDADTFSPRTHGGTSLDVIAKATLGVGKIGKGVDAPVWYQAGQVQRVVNYCADDVCLERELTDFVDRYGYVIDRNGCRLPLPYYPGIASPSS